jgi:hypothetical protein
MYFGGNMAWPWEPDLRAIDREAEVAWFAREYAAELAELREVLGVAPQFGWGLLSWLS